MATKKKKPGRPAVKPVPPPESFVRVLGPSKAQHAYWQLVCVAPTGDENQPECGKRFEARRDNIVATKSQPVPRIISCGCQRRRRDFSTMGRMKAGKT